MRAFVCVYVFMCLYVCLCAFVCKCVCACVFVLILPKMSLLDTFIHARTLYFRLARLDMHMHTHMQATVSLYVEALRKLSRRCNVRLLVMPVPPPSDDGDSDAGDDGNNDDDDDCDCTSSSKSMPHTGRDRHRTGSRGGGVLTC